MRSDQLSRNRLRTRLEATLLEAGDASTTKLHGRAKQAAFASLRGTIVEIGPGTGVNMRWYPPGVKVIGLEPNRILHPQLARAASEHGVDLEIIGDGAERIALENASVDAVIGTLVLCGVEDPAAVLAETMRVLRPGGSYFFIEHVAGPRGTALRRVQDIVRPVHAWLFNGCQVNRDTAATIQAAGFAQVKIEAVTAGPQAMHVRSQIRGIATR